MTHHYHPKSKFTVGFTLQVIHSVSLGKYIMTCIYHHGIIQSSFTILRIPYAPPIYPSLYSQPLATTNLFTVFHSFPEWHIVGIIQYLAFSDWLLSLSNMHLRFFCVFSWLYFFSQRLTEPDICIYYLSAATIL